MIDIHNKTPTSREAVAQGRICMSEAAITALSSGNLPKGDALAAARIAGILAGKHTPALIPLCHPIPLSYLEIEFEVDKARGEILIEATARAHASTGVEMEALTAVAVAALTIHDMCKGIDPGAQIRNICLIRKSGGRSDPWQRTEG